jgi:hypothetical protein
MGKGACFVCLVCLFGAMSCLGSGPSLNGLGAACDAPADCSAGFTCYDKTCHIKAQRPSDCPSAAPDYVAAEGICKGPELLSNQLDEVQVMGLTPPAGACGGTASGDAVMRFVLLGADRGSIGPLDSLGSQQVDFGRDSLSLSDAALFELPDVACDACAQRGMACGVSTATYGQELARCNAPTGVSSKEPSFLGARDKDLAFALLVENTASLTGRLPASVGYLFPDRDGDGVTDAQWSTQSTLEPERATDTFNSRSMLVTQLQTSWKVMAKRAAERRNREAWFGMWTFGGAAASLESLLPGGAELASFGEGAAEDGGQVDQAVSAFFGSQVRAEEAGIYEAMLAIITSVDRLGRADLAGADKLLVVFVDGPDELRHQALSADKVIEEARAKGVKIVIVHLDPAVKRMSSSGEPYFVDVPSYVERQEACGSDFECHNFEECRQTTGYATQQGQSPEQPAGVNLNANYCHLKRDSSGRVGPVDEYARIACETGGGYIYVPASGLGGELAARAGWLPFVQDGLWEVPVELEALARGEVASDQPYKVQLNVSATVLGVQKAQSMSQLGLEFGEGDARDTRQILFSEQR